MKDLVLKDLGLGRRIAVLLAVAFSGLGLAAPLAAGEDPHRTAILCAYESEWKALLPSVVDRHEETWAGITYVTGRIEGEPVLLIQSGVSMVNAAMATQIAIDRRRIGRIVVMGISGGANPDLHIGDVVIPERWSEYLESVFAREVDGKYVLPGFFAVPQDEHFGMIFPQPARLPQPTGATENRTWFPVDPRLFQVARGIPAETKLETCTATGRCLDAAPRLIVGGSGVSGPAFVDNAAFRTFVRRVFAADALDMESAGVAHVAAMNGIPFLAIRSLSDLAGADPDRNQVETFAKLASANATAVLKALLKHLPGKQ